MANRGAWSYTSLQKFLTCPRQYEAQYITKLIKFTETPATRWGNAVHKAMEDAVGKGVPLPSNMAHYQEVVDFFRSKPGQKYTEISMGLKKDGTPCGFWDDGVDVRGKIDLLIIDGDRAWVVDYKGLPLDTRLPTPTGWTTMGEVAVGDKLIGRDGKPCTVTGKSQVKNLPCYEILFDDTTRVKCDEEHLWSLVDGSVVPVTELSPGDAIPTAQPLELPEATLPVDPWLLGMWLADGKHTSGEICKPERWVWEEISRRGFQYGANYSERDKAETRTVYGLRTRLRAAGVLGRKHIPASYMRASIPQRLDLLRGILDGDGHANKKRKQAVLNTTNERWAYEVAELALTLGQRPLVSKVRGRGFGKDVDVWVVSFRPRLFNPFSMPRKAAVLQDVGAGESWRRVVKSVTLIPSEPTQCVAVDSADNTYLCTDKYVPTHNTGKPKDDPLQLRLFALFVFHTYPHIKKVRSMYVWLGENKKVDKLDYLSDQLDDLWTDFDREIATLDAAYEVGVFNPKPSGLCKAHCGVTTCEYYGKGRSR